MVDHEEKFTTNTGVNLDRFSMRSLTSFQKDVREEIHNDQRRKKDLTEYWQNIMSKTQDRKRRLIQTIEELHKYNQEAVEQHVQPIKDFYHDMPHLFNINDPELQHKARRHFEVKREDYERQKEN